MSILADHEIKKLCSLGPIYRIDELEEQLRADETFMAEVREYVASSPNQNHTLLLEQVTFNRRLWNRWNDQPFGMIYPFHEELVREVLAVANTETAVDVPVEVSDNHQKVAALAASLRQDISHITRNKIVSKGLTSYGYDVSLSDDVKLFTNINSATIDPKRFNEEESLVDATVKTDPRDGSRYVILPPNSYLLGVTQEYFRIPRNVMVICLGKSTYARCGAIVNATPIEPGFKGNVVIEVSNSTPSPMRIYVNEGIAQFLFFEGSECEISYADRGGKYMNQTGVTLPKV